MTTFRSSKQILNSEHVTSRNRLIETRPSHVTCRAVFPQLVFHFRCFLETRQYFCFPKSLQLLATSQSRFQKGSLFSASFEKYVLQSNHTSNHFKITTGQPFSKLKDIKKKFLKKIII
jgi:hypothetical protein